MYELNLNVYVGIDTFSDIYPAKVVIIYHGAISIKSYL